MENEYYPFTNLPLPYDYNAMEPYIDEKTMRLHHDRHLQTYIDNLNRILEENPDLQKLSLRELILSVPRLPYPVQLGVLNNAGGVYNHRFYFDVLANPAKQQPERKLAEAIARDFGGIEAFCREFKKAALSVFGSGYAWLVSDRGSLKIVTTPNQNTTLSMGLCPIINIDVWEHAYYLKHYNVRADYIEDWFRILNWEKAEENFTSCSY
jgi:Fe-Mn family superoxide dismutase